MQAVDRNHLEFEISNAVSTFHCDQQGRAPGKIQTTIAGNMVYVLSSDVFTPCEWELHQSEEGRKLIKSARRELRSLTRAAAHATIERIVGCPVLRSYWDLDVRIGEQLEAYVLSQPIDTQRQAGLL